MRKVNAHEQEGVGMVYRQMTFSLYSNFSSRFLLSAKGPKVSRTYSLCSSVMLPLLHAKYWVELSSFMTNILNLGLLPSKPYIREN